ncbi:MAG: hypothetical protein ACKVQA_26445, partial [Burkholderiales bacterium]
LLSLLFSQNSSFDYLFIILLENETALLFVILSHQLQPWLSKPIATRESLLLTLPTFKIF